MRHLLYIFESSFPFIWPFSSYVRWELAMEASLFSKRQRECMILGCFFKALHWGFLKCLREMSRREGGIDSAWLMEDADNFVGGK